MTCARCGNLLHRHVPDSIERALALSIAGLVLLAVANLLPFIDLSIGGAEAHTTLSTGVQALWQEGKWFLATLVLFTCIVAPLIQLSLMVYVFLPLRAGFVPALARPALRAIHHLREWNMVEVFMLGILVAAVKLAKMATIVPGIAMWSFMGMIFIIAGALASIDRQVVWNRLENLS